jgi:hypothetical protein
MSTLRTHNPFKRGYKSTVYYYWFEFLKRSDPKERSKKVRDDFGDIDNADFMDWWRTTGFELFYFFDLSEFPTMGVLNLETAQESLEAGRFMVSIDMTFPKKVIMDRLKAIVEKRVISKVGRRKFRADKGGKYTVQSYVDTNALMKTLAVYDLCKKNEPLTGNDKLKRWQIEERIGLIDKKASALWKMGKTTKELADKRKVQTATVSRYLRHANEIIENVAKHGKFPVHGR